MYRRRLLVVDDDPAIRTAVAEGMARFADVVGTSDPAEAITVAEGPEKLDIAIVSFRLAGTEVGLDLIDQIGARKPDCTLVLMASCRPSLLPDSLVTLRKPFTAVELHSVLTTAVALKTGNYPGVGWRYDRK